MGHARGCPPRSWRSRCSRTGSGPASAARAPSCGSHPAGSTVPIMVLSGGAIAFLLFSAVSIHVIHPQAANQSDAEPVASARARSAAGRRARRPAWRSRKRRERREPAGFRRLGGPGSGDRRPAADPAGQRPGGPAGPGRGRRGGRGAGSAPAERRAGQGAADRRQRQNGGGKSSGDGTRRATLSGGANPSQVTPQQTTPATSAASAPRPPRPRRRASSERPAASA